jgi:SAM-dependent methyltransferase
MTDRAYFDSRFAFDPRREVVWREIVGYFHRQGIVPRGATVLELGAGYAHFINNVDARRRIALDGSDITVEYAKPGVEVLTQRCDEPLPLDSSSVDVVFASNLFEHLSSAQLQATAREVLRVLKPGGRLIAMQPNYRYCAREYFDDYTHVSVFSHVSLEDFFSSQGFRSVLVVPRFMPFSMKSRLPVVPAAIRLYLSLPVRPFAKQMLLAFEKGRSAESAPQRVEATVAGTTG